MHVQDIQLYYMYNTPKTPHTCNTCAGYTAVLYV